MIPHIQPNHTTPFAESDLEDSCLKTLRPIENTLINILNNIENQHLHYSTIDYYRKQINSIRILCAEKDGFTSRLDEKIRGIEALFILDPLLEFVQSRKRLAENSDTYLKQFEKPLERFFNLNFTPEDSLAEKNNFNETCSTILSLFETRFPPSIKSLHNDFHLSDTKYNMLEFEIEHSILELRNLGLVDGNDDHDLSDDQDSHLKPRYAELAKKIEQTVLTALEHSKKAHLSVMEMFNFYEASQSYLPYLESSIDIGMRLRHIRLTIPERRRHSKALELSRATIRSIKAAEIFKLECSSKNIKIGRLIHLLKEASVWAVLQHDKIEAALKAYPDWNEDFRTRYDSNLIHNVKQTVKNVPLIGWLFS